VRPRLGQRPVDRDRTLDVGPTPFFIEVFDETTGAKTAGCSTGTTCSGSVSEAPPARDLFITYVSDFASWLPPSDIRATSDEAAVTWVRSSVAVPNLGRYIPALGAPSG
jgi:hypothetical protein